MTMTTFLTAIKTSLGSSFQIPWVVTSEVNGQSEVNSQEAPHVDVTPNAPEKTESAEIKTWNQELRSKLKQCFYKPPDLLFIPLAFRSGIYLYDIVESLSRELLKNYPMIVCADPDLNQVFNFTESSSILLYDEMDRSSARYSSFQEVFRNWIHETIINADLLSQVESISQSQRQLKILKRLDSSFHQIFDSFNTLLLRVEEDLEILKEREDQFQKWTILKPTLIERVYGTAQDYLGLGMVNRLHIPNLFNGKNLVIKRVWNFKEAYEIVRDFYHDYRKILDFHSLYLKEFQTQLKVVLHEIPAVQQRVDDALNAHRI
jgi:hypothetical protein